MLRSEMIRALMYYFNVKTSHQYLEAPWCLYQHVLPFPLVVFQGDGDVVAAYIIHEI